MLTGKPPFSGDNISAIMFPILNEMPVLCFGREIGVSRRVQAGSQAQPKIQPDPRRGGTSDLGAGISRAEERRDKQV